MAAAQGPLVKSSTLLDVSGAVPQGVVKSLLAACRTSSFAKIQAKVADSIADGWPVPPLPPYTQTSNPKITPSILGKLKQLFLPQS